MKYLMRSSLLCLMLALGCLTLAACGGDTEAETDAPDGTQATVSVTVAEPDLPTGAENTQPSLPDTQPETPTTAPTEPVTAPETEPETETETAPDYAQDYTATYDYAFLCKAGNATSHTVVKGKTTSGARFTVGKDCFLTSLSTFCPSWGDNIGSMDMAIYRWDADYDTTVAAEPVFIANVTDYPDNSRGTFHIPEGAVGEGEWLYIYCNGSENSVGVYLCTMPNTGDDEQGITAVEGYHGNHKTKSVPQSFVTYVRYEPKTADVVPVDPRAYTKLTEGKAHVIVLSGQSNAAGQSLRSYLSQNVPEEVYARYRSGYENILIDYAVDGWNESNGFGPVRLGQGSQPDRFGPEVGLADYLDRTYPGETFYIIKCAWSGVGLAKHWQDDNTEYQYFLRNLCASLDRLRGMGLDPEVFAFCWMQGETDSFYVEDSIRYAELQDDMIARITAAIQDDVAPNGFAFLDAAISDSVCWTFNGIVNTEKRRCDALSQNRYYLDTIAAGLQCEHENNDIAHYDSMDMIKLGEMYGEAVKVVMDNATP